MPESLQQKVDRMTAGTEVTVTFGGDYPGTVSGPVRLGVYPGQLRVVGQFVRGADHQPPPDITAIDMPDPEPPFEMGARVVGVGDGSKRVWTVTDWLFDDAFEAWMVRLADGNIRGLSDPDELTLAPPEPAEPDPPAILVTYTGGYQEVAAANRHGGLGRYPLAVWLGKSDVATVQALRPAEYLRGGA